jgi:hypothetical protein
MRTCKQGMIRLRGTRKCIKGIGALRKGDLTQFGYHTDLAADKRHAALKKAVEKYGALSVFRKLNAVYVYNKAKSPKSSAVFLTDRNWTKRTFM